jgi:hypothetical protein
MDFSEALALENTMSAHIQCIYTTFVEAIPEAFQPIFELRNLDELAVSYQVICGQDIPDLRFRRPL